MTRHFLRDKNGEEIEVSKPADADLAPYFIWSSILPGLKVAVLVDKTEIWINNKLEFVVWQEV